MFFIIFRDCSPTVTSMMMKKKCGDETIIREVWTSIEPLTKFGDLRYANIINSSRSHVKLPIKVEPTVP
jgi:hypothetical protein